MTRDEAIEAGARCKHCGFTITRGAMPLHADGPNHHLHRCAPTPERRYGYTACPEGADCGPLCIGGDER